MANQLASEAAADPRLAIGGNKPPKVHELFASELTETYSIELARTEPIAQRANTAPEKIESDEDLKAWTAIYLDADRLYRQLDEARLIEKRPMEAVLKTVFGPTLDRLERITSHARKLSDAYNREKVKKEREAREAEQRRAREAAEKAKQDAQIAAEFGDADAVVEHAQAAAANEAEAARITSEAPKAADVARVRADDGALSTAKTEFKFEIADYSKVDLNAIRQFFTPKEINTAVGKVVRLQKGATKIDGVRVYEDVATQFRR